MKERFSISLYLSLTDLAGLYPPAGHLCVKVVIEVGLHPPRFLLLFQTLNPTQLVKLLPGLNGANELPSLFCISRAGEGDAVASLVGLFA